MVATSRSNCCELANLRKETVAHEVHGSWELGIQRRSKLLVLLALVLFGPNLAESMLGEVLSDTEMDVLRDFGKSITSQGAGTEPPCTLRLFGQGYGSHTLCMPPTKGNHSCATQPHPPLGRQRE